MAVYVDDMKALYRGMIMCHMSADTHDELITMADLIGVDRRWIQYPGTFREHFDICTPMRKLAVKNGAEEVSTKELVKRNMLKPNSPYASKLASS